MSMTVDESTKIASYAVWIKPEIFTRCWRIVCAATGSVGIATRSITSNTVWEIVKISLSYGLFCMPDAACGQRIGSRFRSVQCVADPRISVLARHEDHGDESQAQPYHDVVHRRQRRTRQLDQPRHEELREA